MFAVVSNYVNVHEKFYFYLLNFLYNAYTLETDSAAIKNYAGFTIGNFVKNRNLDDRQVKATEADVKTIIVGLSETETSDGPHLFHDRKLRRTESGSLREF